MDLSAYSAWKFIIQIAIIVVVIIIGNIIRRKVPFIKNSLLPSSVLGGIIIFILKFIPGADKVVDSGFMEIITYHCLGLGFVALGLKTEKKMKEDRRLIVLDSGIITVNGYLVQAILGLGATILLSQFVIKDFFPAAGALLPMGFGQGTGQALNMGKVFEGLGFENGTTFGLSIAAVGFVVACLVGVLYLNILKKKGKLSVQERRINQNNEMKESIYDADEAPVNESVDKLTVQLGLIFGVYLVTYGIIYLGSYLAKSYLGNFGVNTVSPLLWGFNFLFGSLFAILLKKIMRGLKKAKIMTHQHVNNYLMNRISGFFFDVMIVAGIAAIDWQNLQGLLIPLIMVCVLGTLGTFFYLKAVCKRIYPTYEYEGFFSYFGMLTGTASTGMILLREIDPNFETPAANNLVLQQLPAIIFGAPILLLIPFAGESLENAILVFCIVCVLFVVYNIILLRRDIFKLGRRKKNVKNKD